jgi:hypothetical protein
VNSVNIWISAVNHEIFGGNTCHNVAHPWMDFTELSKSSVSNDIWFTFLLLASHMQYMMDKLAPYCVHTHYCLQTYLWQIHLFLFLTAMLKNLIDTEIGVCSIAQTYGSRCSTQLLHYNNMRQISQVWTSIFTGDCRTQCSQVTKLTPECLKTDMLKI